MKKKFKINPDISKAETLPSSFYKDLSIFELVKNKVFLRSWQWIGDENLINESVNLHPFVLLEGYLDEPLLLSKNNVNEIKCISNVCTHRGNLLILNSCKSSKIRCSYHGRRFDLNGNYEYMPDFEKTKNFPKDCDNLNKFSLKKWNKLLFIGLEPKVDLTNILNIMENRVGFLPLENCIFDSTLSRTFNIDAHWALYCDNYLEGFHVPFVHQGLSEILDYDSYDTEIFDYCNLQIGYSNSNENCFNFPLNHQDYGKNIAAYYFWIFPNMMFNFYPWGISINIVTPINVKSTRIDFKSYVFDYNKLNKGAGSDLDKVEEEDEFVVQNVQKGINSRYYYSGRFSPTKEKGVHHFHYLISKFIDN